jgi:hypothetical protein
MALTKVMLRRQLSCRASAAASDFDKTSADGAVIGFLPLIAPKSHAQM